MLADSRASLYGEMEEIGRLPVDEIRGAIVVPRARLLSEPRIVNAYRSLYLRSANPDEQKSLTYLGSMKPRELNFEPFGIDYGGAYLYPLGAYYYFLKTIGIVEATGDLTRYFENPSRMARVFLAGRAFNLICFMICVALIYRLGKLLGGRFAALSGAAIFAAAPVYVLNVHTLNPYGWATLWFLSGILFLFRYLETGNRRALLAGAVAVGMCIGSSLAFLSVGVALLAPFLRVRSRERDSWKEAGFEFLAAAAAAGLVFVATNPYLFLRFEKFVDQMLFLTKSFPLDPSLRGFFGFFTRFLPPSFGVIQFALGGAALAFAAVKIKTDRRRALIVLVLFAGILNLGGRSLDDFAHSRHFLPFFALWAVLIGGVLSDFAPGNRKIAVYTLLVFGLAEAGVRSLGYAKQFSMESGGRSSRMIAGKWINANIPEGKLVGLVRPPQYAHTPPFRFDRYSFLLFAAPGQLRGFDYPEFVVAGETGLTRAVEEFLEERYDTVASFGGEPLLLGNPVDRFATHADIIIRVFRLRDRHGRNLDGEL